MVKIDAHQHFWRFNPLRDSWITDEMSAIRRSFLPEDLFPLLQENGIDGCIAVQSDQTEADNEFLLGLADKNDFIKGVVGWIDLRSDKAAERLEFYQQYDKMKGFRHVLQAEPDEQFMLRPDFKRGISLLQQYGFTYDVLIFPNHLPYARQLVSAFPEQKFVIDHLAKPYIKSGKIGSWEKDIRAIAHYPNVFCKVSGMVTEADWSLWKPEDFEPYLDVVFNAFEADRVLYGSDWPVCLLAGGYSRVIEIVQGYTSRLSAGEQEFFWGGNAQNFYNL